MIVSRSTDLGYGYALLPLTVYVLDNPLSQTQYTCLMQRLGDNPDDNVCCRIIITIMYMLSEL